MALTLVPPETRPLPSNGDLAAVFDEVADLLEVQEADPFRIRAWRRGASAVRQLDGSVALLFEREGEKGLIELEHIGRRLAASIGEIVHTGQLAYLERLRGEATVECLLQTLPGIGPVLAAQVHEILGIETLEELEIAAHDGRLERVPGFGPARTKLVRDMLAHRLRQQSKQRAHRMRELSSTPATPGVDLLLALDREYRTRAAAGTLRRIAPRRFNPTHAAWLPVMHTTRGGWDFTVLFSNTARAHQLGRTDDWVVMYYHHHGTERQCTVVTEHNGDLAGQRVVRGRERECAEHYAQQVA